MHPPAHHPHLPAPSRGSGPRSARKRRTVLTWGLGADSTANILRFINDPVGNGLEPDLSDLVIVHAVTGDEFSDSLSYADRLVLPLLRAWRIRLVQVCRGGPRDADGVLVLDDSRAPRRIHAVVDQGGAPVDAEPQCLGDDERCRGAQQKGPTWRSVRTVYEGPRERAEGLVTRFAGRFPDRVRLVDGEASGIRRAHYLDDPEGLPHAEAFIVAAPAGVADKQRPGFEKRWKEHTGKRPVFRPLRDLPEPAPRKRSAGGPAPLHRARVIGDVLLIA